MVAGIQRQRRLRPPDGGQGFQFVTVGSDARFMAAGARAAVDRMKARAGRRPAPATESGETHEKRPKTYDQLRSARWYGVPTLRAFGHHSRTKQMGFAAEDYQGKPVIGIINTWSDMNSCHTHFPSGSKKSSAASRGRPAGFPSNCRAMSVGEPFVKPTTMLYRNLLAMEVEELLRSHPIDGVVLAWAVATRRRRRFWQPPR